MLKEHGNPCVHSMRLLNQKTSIIPTQGQEVTKALQHTVVNTYRGIQHENNMLFNTLPSATSENFLIKSRLFI